MYAVLGTEAQKGNFMHMCSRQTDDFQLQFTLKGEQT